MSSIMLHWIFFWVIPLFKRVCCSLVHCGTEVCLQQGSNASSLCFNSLPSSNLQYQARHPDADSWALPPPVSVQRSLLHISKTAVSLPCHAAFTSSRAAHALCSLHLPSLSSKRGCSKTWNVCEEQGFTHSAATLQL